MQSIVKRGASINKCDSKTLNLASEILKHDLGLVAFPTETVYGLGAQIRNKKQCEMVFQIKERPFTDPLIVHVNNLEQAVELIDRQDFKEQGALFNTLARWFWPGPLTMIMKVGSDKVPEVVTAGTGNVALRMPNTHAALHITQNCPVAAPSANIFGHVSPTTAQHVYDDFHTNELRHVFIVDDGPCKIGIESTVIRLCQNNIQIIRTGGVSEEMIKQKLLSESMQIDVKTVPRKKKVSEIENQISPGQFLRHYAPNIDTFLISPKTDIPASVLKESVVIDFGQEFLQVQAKCKHYADLSPESLVDKAAEQLYTQLRWAENQPDVKQILIVDMSKKPDLKGDFKDALFDRIYKATSGGRQL